MPKSLAVQYSLGGGFKCFDFHPYVGKMSTLTNIFQNMGWNHQPVLVWYEQMIIMIGKEDILGI